MTTPRCLILIDGSNFYFGLKRYGLYNLLRFNYSRFSDFVLGDCSLVSAYYYIGKVRQDGTERADKMVSDQQKLFEMLKFAGFEYKLGYILKSSGIYHEKGVDVQIAVDIVVAAYEDLCDKIILVSSDTDLGPAVKKAREKGKEVEYVGFANNPSRAMMSFCSSTQLLKRKKLLRFLSKARPDLPLNTWG